MKACIFPGRAGAHRAFPTYLLFPTTETTVRSFGPYKSFDHTFMDNTSLITDHHALGWLLSLKNLSRHLGRWVLHLKYKFDVYKSGKKNQNANTLSRCPLPLSSSRDSLHSSSRDDDTTLSLCYH